MEFTAPSMMPTALSFIYANVDFTPAHTVNACTGMQSKTTSCSQSDVPLGRAELALQCKRAGYASLLAIGFEDPACVGSCVAYQGLNVLI